NETVVSTFMLLEFGSIPEVQSLLFFLFFTIYVMTVIGNSLILVLVVADQHLHTPMYFFLCNLSCLEICYSSTILPRMLSSFLSGDKSISIGSCITQLYFFGSLAVTESFLLSAMSYDRYLAVCKPLHYRAAMSSRFCLQLVAWSWMSGLLVMAISCFLILQHSFCGPRFINHFFCDFTPLIKLSCCDTSLTEMVVSILSSLCALPPFLLTLVSYTCVITTVLRMSSTTGTQKAFSTCFSHLIVITVFYGSLITVYILPRTRTLRALNKVFSVFYTVVTPLLNPLIYSLRNREVKDALWKVVKKC
ncbi:Olfactory receptor 1030, partial [Dryobates pubescens]